MARVIALVQSRNPPLGEALRSLIVRACALALILAGQVLPY